MKTKKSRKTAIIAIAVIAVGIIAWLIARQVAAKPYQNLVSFTYSNGGGYGLWEEMTSGRLTVDFATGAMEWEITKDMDGTLIDRWEITLEQSQLEALRNTLVSNKFLSLPESFDDISLDASKTTMTLTTAETVHTTSGYMPGNKQFRAVQDAVRELREQAAP